jgi:7,8-dihydropterin-6-yl-methyl-4-(beta-D-ribofuranosyl)aminobenzene 5'-phosphate synthase
VLAENPVVIGHAFTTGRIKRRTIERVTGGARVEYATKDGFGCNASHFAPAEQLGKIVTDEHYHEHATCYNVKDRGLVVLSSCGHVGIVNSAKQAQEVSGVQKVHALVGGFHLGASPDWSTWQRTRAPDVVSGAGLCRSRWTDELRSQHC